MPFPNGFDDPRPACRSLAAESSAASCSFEKDGQGASESAQREILLGLAPFPEATNGFNDPGPARCSFVAKSLVASCSFFKDGVKGASKSAQRETLLGLAPFSEATIRFDDPRPASRSLAAESSAASCSFEKDGQGASESAQREILLSLDPFSEASPVVSDADRDVFDEEGSIRKDDSESPNDGGLASASFWAALAWRIPALARSSDSCMLLFLASIDLQMLMT